MREAVLLSVPAWLAYAFTMLAFYPAVMTIDSLDQWAQINYHSYTDWHPPLHTLLMALLRKIWDSPAMIASCQSFAMGMAIGTLVAVVRRASGARLRFAAVGSVLVAIFPLSLVMTVTLWKDVFYTVAVLLLAAGAVATVCLGRRPLSSPLAFVGALVVAVACMTFRHNGPPVAIVLVVLVAILVPAQRKVALGFLLSACVVTALCQGPGLDAAKVKRTHASVAILAHHIAAHLAVGSLPKRESDRELISAINPRGWDYNCALVNYTIFVEGFDLPLATQHRDELRSLWWRMAKAHPGTELRHLLCVSALVWNPLQSGSAYLYTVGVIPDDSHTRWISPNDLGIHESSPLGAVGQAYRNGLFRFIDEVWLVGPAGYLYALLAACGLAAAFARRRAGKVALCVAATAVAQSAPLLIANVAQDARYQLPIYVLSLCLVPVMLAAALKGRPSTAGHPTA